MLILVLAAAIVSNAVPQIVSGLAGCWTAHGEVRGKDASSVAKGEWHLGKRYFTLHLRSVAPASPYEAAITYGAGEKPTQIGSIWMDTFGGLYEPSLGLGTVEADGFVVDYRFPDAIYHNRLEHQSKGWRWTIVEQAPGKPDRLFAQYDLVRSSCAHLKFGF